MLQNELEIQGQRFAIANDVDCEWYSPFLDGEEVTIDGERFNPQGNYTLPLDLDLTPALSRLLDSPQLLQRDNRTITFSGAVLFSNGLRVDSGYIDIVKVQQQLNNRNGKIQVQFYSDNVTFIDVVADKNVKDLVLHGPLTIAGLGIASYMLELGTAFPDPIWKIEPADIDNPKGTLTVQRGNDVWRYIYDQYDIDQLQTTTLFAATIMQGFEPVDLIQPDRPIPDLLPWIVFPCYYGDYPESHDDSLHGVLNHVGTDGLQGHIRTLFDGVTGNDFVHNIPLRNQIVPMYYYHKVLRACFEENGYTLEGELLEDPQFLKLILPNTYSILKEEVLAVENLWGTNTNIQNLLYAQTSTDLIPANHLPDIAIIDFIRDCMLRHNVTFTFIGTRCIMKGNTLNSPSKEYNGIDPTVLSETKKSRGLTVKYKFDSTDTSYAKQLAYKDTLDVKTFEAESGDISTLADGKTFIWNTRNSINRKDTSNIAGYEFTINNLVPYVTGKDKVFEAELTPVEMDSFGYIRSNNPDDDTARQTYLAYYGHSPSIYSLSLYILKWKEENAFGDVFTYVDFGGHELFEGDREKKIALYHGPQQTLEWEGEIYQYPYMAFHNYAPKNDGTGTKLGNWHLGWHGAEGLIATHWREWVKVFSGWKVTFNIGLTWKDLTGHSWTGSTIIRGRKYYITAIKFRLPAFLNKVKAIVEAFEL